MRVVTANIKKDLFRRKSRRAMKATSKLGGAILWQEIKDPVDVANLHDILPPRYWLHFFENLEIPMSFKRKYWRPAVAAELPPGTPLSGFDLMHHGRALTSPNRYVAWVVMAKKNRSNRAKRAKIICFMNSHFVSGAWNKRLKLHKKWRKEAWNQHWGRMKELVLFFYHNGITVIFGGDFNRRDVEKFHERQRWLVQHGIDKIGVLVSRRGGTRVSAVESGHEKTASDHDAVWAKLDMRLAA